MSLTPNVCVAVAGLTALTPVLFEEEKHLLEATIVGDCNDPAQTAFKFSDLRSLFNWKLDTTIVGPTTGPTASE
jgi:hypothetical protein